MRLASFLKKIATPSFPKAIAFAVMVTSGLFFYSKMQSVSTVSLAPKTRLPATLPSTVEPPIIAMRDDVPADVAKMKKKKKKVKRELRKLKRKLKKKKKRLRKKWKENQSSLELPAEVAALIHFEPDEDGQLRALNHPSPLDTLVETALLEDPQAPHFDVNPRIARAQLEPSFYLDWQYPEVPLYRETIGAFKEQDFAQFKSELAETQSEVSQWVTQRKLTTPPTPVVVVENSISKAKDKPLATELDTVAFPSHTKGFSGRSEVVHLAKLLKVDPKDVRLRTDREITTARGSMVAHVQPDRLFPLEELPDQLEKRHSAEKESRIASVGSPVVGRPPSPTVNRQPTNVITQNESKQSDYSPKEDTQPKSVLLARANIPAKETHNVVVDPNEHKKGKTRHGRKLHGEVEVDDALDQWLLKTKGHFSLHLIPEKSVDPRDARYDAVDYQYPDRDFIVDTRKAKQPHKLVARFFKPDFSSPVSEIEHPGPISSETRKRVLFQLTRKAFDKNQRQKQKNPGTTSLTISVFDMTASGYPLSNATVRIVGFPGIAQTRIDGNSIKFESLPTHSEYMIEVAAPKYFPTYQTIPVFSAEAYHAVYLVSEERVKTVTRDFTKKQQDPSLAVIEGRMREPTTLSPLEGESVTLSFRKGRGGHPLYFGLLPDPLLMATTVLGQFAYYNVRSSNTAYNAFRSLHREGKPSLLVNARPGTASFVQFGWSGKAKLEFQVVDPYRGKLDPKGIRLADVRNFSKSKENAPVLSGEFKDSPNLRETKRGFEFTQFDLPPGVVTTEISAEGYPVTLHTMPWDAIESLNQRYLAMFEQDVFDEGRHIAGVSLEKHTGHLIGVGDKAFYQRGPCTYVELRDANGKQVPEEHGPYSTLEKTGAPLCLTEARPGYAYYNLPPGEYILTWLDAKRKPFRTHVHRVGKNRLTSALN